MGDTQFSGKFVARTKLLHVGAIFLGIAGKPAKLMFSTGNNRIRLKARRSVYIHLIPRRNIIMGLIAVAHARLKWPLLLALAVIVIRIFLEQLGAPESINNLFGVAWLYFLVPVFFGLEIARHRDPSPLKSLFVHVLLFGVYTRLMVAITYMMAYAWQWTSPRFLVERGGTVGEGISPLEGYLIIPLRNAVLWIIGATLVGMIVGGITILIKQQPADERNEE